MLLFDQLQLVIGKLRFHDEMALRAIGLVKLAKVYDAYPLHDGGRKLYCLLPKGMDSAKARQLSQSAAVRQIVVLQETGKKLEKIWPNEAGATVASNAEAAAPPLDAAASVGELLEE